MATDLVQLSRAVAALAAFSCYLIIGVICQQQKGGLKCSGLATQYDFSGAQSVLLNNGNNNWTYATQEQLTSEQPLDTTLYIVCTSGKYFPYSCNPSDDSKTASWSSQDTCSQSPTCPPFAGQLVNSDDPQITIGMYDFTLNDWVVVSLDSTEIASEQQIGATFAVACSNGKTYQQQCTAGSDASQPSYWNPQDSSCTGGQQSQSPTMCVPVSGQLTFDDIAAVAKYDKATPGEWAYLSPNSSDLYVQQPIGTYFAVSCGSNGKIVKRECIASSWDISQQPRWSPQDETCSSEELTCPPLFNQLGIDDVDYAEQLFNEGGSAYVDLGSSEYVSPVNVGGTFSVNCRNGKTFKLSCINSNNNAYWSSQETCTFSAPTAVTTCQSLGSLLDFDEVASVERMSHQGHWTDVPIGSPELTTELQTVGVNYWITCKNGKSFSKRCDALVNTAVYDPTQSMAYWYPQDDCKQGPMCSALTDLLPATELKSVEKLDIKNSWHYSKIDWDEVAKPQPLKTDFHLTCQNGKTLSVNCMSMTSFVNYDMPFGSGDATSYNDTDVVPPNEESRDVVNNDTPSWFPEPSCKQLMCPALSGQLNLADVKSVSRSTGYINGITYSYSDLSVSSAEMATEQAEGTSFGIVCKNGKRVIVDCVAVGGVAMWYHLTNCSDVAFCPPLNLQPFFRDLQSIEWLENEMSRYVPLSSYDLSKQQIEGALYSLQCKNGKYFRQNCMANSTTVGIWYPQDDCIIPMCPPLDSFDDNVVTIEKFDPSSYIWQNTGTISSLTNEEQPLDTVFWVGCQSGASYTQFCSRDYDGAPKWFSESNCTDAQVSSYLPSPLGSSANSNSTAKCPALINREGFGDDVVSMEKLDASLQWNPVTNLSNEMIANQPPGTYLWIACRNGRSFVQHCEEQFNRDAFTAYWNPYEMCSNGAVIPTNNDAGNLSCSALKSKLTLDDIASFFKYYDHQWKPFFPSSPEALTPQDVGSYYQIFCKNGAAFSMKCDSSSRQWLSSESTTDCPTLAAVPPPSSSATCPPLTDVLPIDGVMNLEKYDSARQAWTPTSFQAMKPSSQRSPTGQKLWIGCSNGGSLIQQCGAAGSWLEKRTCLTAETPFSKSATTQQSITGNTTYFYGVKAQIRVKRVRIPKSKVGATNSTRRRRAATSTQDLVDITPQNFNADVNSEVYKAVKDTFTTQLMATHTQAGLPASNIDISLLNSTVNEIVANYSTTVKSDQQIDQAAIKTRVSTAISQLQQSGHFNDSFGSDGISTLDIYDFFSVIAQPIEPAKRNSAAHMQTVLAPEITLFAALMLAFLLYF